MMITIRLKFRQSTQVPQVPVHSGFQAAVGEVEVDGVRDGSWPPLGSVRLLSLVKSARILKIEVTLLAASSATIFALKG
jgi:hypothetical protein